MYVQQKQPPHEIAVLKRYKNPVHVAAGQFEKKGDGKPGKGVRQRKKGESPDSRVQDSDDRIELPCLGGGGTEFNS